MKYFMLIGDGMADDLEGQTPLESAATPHMDALASGGEVGRAWTVPKGMAPGSDVAILGLMGYAPEKHYTGRGPLEAAGLGVQLQDDEVVFRCNLVALEGPSMRDYSAGGLSAPEGLRLISDLQEGLGDEGVRFVPGVGYRHLLVMKDPDKGLLRIQCTPPHSITGKPWRDGQPGGEGAARLLTLMKSAEAILASHPVNRDRASRGLLQANAIWPWSGGQRTSLPAFESRWGLRAGVISAVALVKSIGLLADMKVFEVEGATGYLDSNLAGKVDAAVRFMERDGDFVLVHVEAPDEAGHHGNAEEKRQAIELFDREVVAGLLGRTEGWDRRFLIVSDHRTPVAKGDHTSDWVPWLMSPGPSGPGRTKFCERSCERASIVASGPELLRMFLQRDPL